MIRDTMLMWDTQRRSLESLALSTGDQTRQKLVFDHASLIASELARVMDEVRQQPHQNPADDQVIIDAAKADARKKVETLAPVLAALKLEMDDDTLTPVPTSKTDPATVLEIRRRLSKADPLEIHAALIAAADSGDAETLTAICDAHPMAHPTIGRALAANPGARDAAAKALRFRDKPALRQQSEAREALYGTLSSVVGDLRREVGEPDQIAIAAGIPRRAAGG